MYVDVDPVEVLVGANFSFVVEARVSLSSASGINSMLSLSREMSLSVVARDSDVGGQYLVWSNLSYTLSLSFFHHDVVLPLETPASW